MESTPPAYETVLEHVSAGVLVFDLAATAVVTTNRAFRELTGYDEESLTDASLTSLTAPDTGESITEHCAQARATGEAVAFEWPLACADGTCRHVDATVSAAANEQVVVTVEGETQALSTDDLAFSKDLISVAPVPIWIQRNDEIRYSNAAAVDFFGVDTPEDLVGRSSMEFVVEDEKDRAQRRTNTVLEERTPARALEGRIRDENGKLKYALFAAAPLDHRGIDDVLVVANDITERREYEATLEQRTKQLQLLNRIVRHDIRNDMQLVLANGRLLEETVDGDAQTYLDRLLSNGEHVVELTRIVGDLMQVMLSDGETELNAVALPSLLRDVVDDVASSYEAASVTVDGDVPNVRVQANEMLGSVFRNAVENAVQHNDSDRPTVRISVAETSETAVVRVADDGPGVPDASKESIFGKGEKGLESDGVGLGLYLVHQLVDLFDGSIHVEDRTEPWETDGQRDGDDRHGAVFVVELPLA